MFMMQMFRSLMLPALDEVAAFVAELGYTFTQPAYDALMEIAMQERSGPAPEALINTIMSEMGVTTQEELFPLLGEITEFIMSGGEYDADMPECHEIAQFVTEELAEMGEFVFPPAACNLLMQMDLENPDDQMMEDLMRMMGITDMTLAMEALEMVKHFFMFETEFRMPDFADLSAYIDTLGYTLNQEAYDILSTIDFDEEPDM